MSFGREPAGSGLIIPFGIGRGGYALERVIGRRMGREEGVIGRRRGREEGRKFI